MKAKQQANRNSTKPYKMITKSSNVEIHLQAGPCTSPPYNQFDMICNSCAEEQPCSFMGLRGFEISTIDGSLVYGPYFPETKKNDLLHSSRSLRFNGKPYSPGAKKYALNQIRSTLRKVLERQKDARSYYNNKAVQRDHTEGYRHLCDTCSTTIFNKHYVCASCAMEICIECYDDLQNMTEGIHTHPKSTNNKHARAEFVLFSKFAKKSISTLLKSTIPKAARSLMRKVKKENDPSAAAMVTASHDTISTGDQVKRQYEYGYGNAAAGSGDLYNNQLAGDANLSVGFVDSHNLQYVGVTEPCCVTAPDDISFPHFSQSTTAFRAIGPTPHSNHDGHSPLLSDSAPSAHQRYTPSSNSIGSAPLLSDSLYSSDRSNVTSCSPTFRPTEALSSIDLGPYFMPSVNDGVDFAPWNPFYQKHTRSDILDNVQINLSTFDNSLFQPNLSPDAVYQEPEYHATNDYSLFEDNSIMYKPQVEYTPDCAQQDYSGFYTDNVPSYTGYGIPTSYDGNTFELGQPPCAVFFPSRSPTPEHKSVQVDPNYQRFTSADLRDSSELGHYDYMGVSSTDVLNVHEEIRHEISHSGQSPEVQDVFGQTIKVEPYEVTSSHVPANIEHLEDTPLSPFVKEENASYQVIGHYEDCAFSGNAHAAQQEAVSPEAPAEHHGSHQDSPSQQSSLSTSSLSHLFSGVKDEQRTSQDGQQFLKIEACNLNLDLFQQHWQTHRPIHVTNSTGNSEFEWTPAMFSTLCGTDTIQATDYDNSVFELNGKDYFDAFSDRKRRQRLCKRLGSSEVLKVKDWPQTQDLQNRLPGLYDDFMRTVPAPEYCSASGYLNLANRLPEEYLPPDLGPKMFISYGSDQHGKTGKTNLHCDITDAVNVMYYADDETARDKPKAASVWHIFPHDQIGQLQEYIRQYKDCDHLHPIFDHAFYLTEQDLVRLEAEFGVVPYTVYQNPGDAVFIPAGCAHQVLNCSNSIKCAFDFLSPENVESSLFISSELRKLHKQDALQVQTTLAFSWVSLKSD